jgi:hypothetical protein
MVRSKWKFFLESMYIIHLTRSWFDSWWSNAIVLMKTKASTKPFDHNFFESSSFYPIKSDFLFLLIEFPLGLLLRFLSYPIILM